MSMCLKSKNNI